MINVKTLAKQLLYRLKEQMQGLQAEEFDVTPLKLQKLLYYCQGYALALTGKPLFSEPVEAWRYGPVVSSVYQEYKKYKGSSIPFEAVDVAEDVDEVTASIVRLVVDEKGRFSGMALANATHSEAPWKDASNDGKIFNNEITQEAMKEFFTEVVLQKELPDDEEDSFWESVGEPMTQADWDAVFANANV